MKRWWLASTDVSKWDTILRLTLIELLLRPAGPWGILPFILLIGCAGLIFTNVLRSPITWFALSGLVAARILADWPLPDNHIYLLAYWCLAVALALRSPISSVTLTRSARLLIGFAFALAVLWKGILSPDFLDNRFFRVTSLIDERFKGSVLLFGGITKNELKQNREYLQALPEGAELLDPPEMVDPPTLRRFAWISTWGSILIETAVAITFLIPSRRFYWLRHAALLLFCMVTYPFAPVAGFGWLLTVMGMAQVYPEHRLLKGVYIAAYFLILLFAEIPWAGAIVESLQG